MILWFCLFRTLPGQLMFKADFFFSGTILDSLTVHLLGPSDLNSHKVSSAPHSADYEYPLALRFQPVQPRPRLCWTFYLLAKPLVEQVGFLVKWVQHKIQAALILCWGAKSANLLGISVPILRPMVQNPAAVLKPNASCGSEGWAWQIARLLEGSFSSCPYGTLYGNAHVIPSSRVKEGKRKWWGEGVGVSPNRSINLL